jgi:hypothetical protein
MNTDLTKEQLDELEDDLAECDPRDAQANRLKRALRMARRTLQAEERLREINKIVQKSYYKKVHGWRNAALSLSYLDSPKGLTPPLPCAPPAHSDAQP